MQLIEKFHKMESESKLFELGGEIQLPIWDIVRYSIYIKYNYSPDGRKWMNKKKVHPIYDYIFLIGHLFKFIYKLLFGRGENIVLCKSRYCTSQGEHYDKSAISIINEMGLNCLVIDRILGKKIIYSYIYDFSMVMRKFIFVKKLPKEYYTKINTALVNYFGENPVSYNELNKVFKNYYKDYCFFKLVFFVKNTKKLFISTGNPKATLLAAKKYNITTYLLQHASIDIDEIDYSYPNGITRHCNILFPNYVLTFGDYWGKNINVPAKKIMPIGNDYFYHFPKVTCDNTILIISTIIHGSELKILTKQLAENSNGLNIVYKLHPNEVHFYTDYKEYFKDNINVLVVANQSDTNLLVAKSKLVILIVSVVLYEALHQKKKVAVYKKINYKRNLSLSNSQNVYFFDRYSDVFEILERPVVQTNANYFKPTNYALINKLINVKE